MTFSNFLIKIKILRHHITKSKKKILISNSKLSKNNQSILKCLSCLENDKYKYWMENSNHNSYSLLTKIKNSKSVIE